jgi:hypothetical protein
MDSCFNCGAELPPRARFCPQCAAPVTATRGAQSAPEPAPVASPASEPASAPPPTGAASAGEACEIRWAHGVTRGNFYATVVRLDGREQDIARSPLFSWRETGPPPRENAAAASAHRVLLARLTAEGWVPAGEPSPWYAQRLTR